MTNNKRAHRGNEGERVGERAHVERKERERERERNGIQKFPPPKKIAFNFCTFNL